MAQAAKQFNIMLEYTVQKVKIASPSLPAIVLSVLNRTVLL